MNRDRIIRELVARFLEEGKEDAIGLWQFPRSVIRLEPTAATEEVRSTSLAIAQELLREGFVVGDLTGDGFIERHPGDLGSLEREWVDPDVLPGFEAPWMWRPELM